MLATSLLYLGYVDPVASKKVCQLCLLVPDTIGIPLKDIQLGAGVPGGRGVLRRWGRGVLRRWGRGVLRRWGRGVLRRWGRGGGVGGWEGRRVNGSLKGARGSKGGEGNLGQGGKGLRSNKREGLGRDNKGEGSENKDGVGGEGVGIKAGREAGGERADQEAVLGERSERE